MQPYLAILNPAAGGGRCRKQAPTALDRLRGAGIDVEVRQTRHPGDGSRIAREGYAEGYRNFLAIGGDGTAFEVVNGLFPLPEGNQGIPKLAFLPLGTGNSFLRDFTDHGTEYALESVIQGRVRKCDVIRLTHREGTLHYINIFSMGFVTAVAVTRNRRFKNWGLLGYLVSTFAEILRLHSRAFPMKIDQNNEDRERMLFFCVNNSRFTGGNMMMAPQADTGDGYADLIRVGRMRRFGVLQAFPKIFRGTHVGMPAVKYQKVRQIDFDLDRECDVMVDGETLQLHPEKLEVLPGILEVAA